MDPIDYSLDTSDDKQQVVCAKEQLETLDLNTTTDGNIKVVSESYAIAQDDGDMLSTSVEEEQVVTGDEKELISEFVVVPQVSTVIVQTEISVSELSVTQLPSSLSINAPQGDDSSSSGRSKWKEVDSEFSPPIDIVELKDSYHIYAEVPGLNVKDISIDLSNNLFTLTGDKRDHPLLARKNKEEGVIVQEINKGRFKRVLELPENVNTNDVAVEYEEGILQFKIRKLEEEKEEEKEEEEVQEETLAATTTEEREATEGEEVEQDQAVLLRKRSKTKGGKKRSSCSIQ